MILISYDISDDKLRTNFSKYLEKFGYRLQYSLFEIKNSDRLLNNIKIDLDSHFKKKFGEKDNVIIIETSKNCKITKYGFTKHDNDDIIVLD